MRISRLCSASACAVFMMMPAVFSINSGDALAAELRQLPKPLKKAAAEYGVDPRAVTVSIVELDGLKMPEGGKMPLVRPLLAVNADRSVAPASTAKLVTTLAGLELLGADWHWKTGFYARTRPDEKGRVTGVWLKGGGDPTLVAEKFALLVDRMAQMGVRHIEGNLTVDRSYFDIPDTDPSAFDGRGSRPYNQLPDAAVTAYRSLSFEFVPDKSAGVAHIVSMPQLAGLEVPSSIPLARGGCSDWKSSIGYRLERLSDGRLVAHFDGALPLACGSKYFNVVSLCKNEFLDRLFRKAWERDERTWTGHVVEGRTPEDAVKLVERESDSLPVVTTLVNKWSNNLIARHIFLTLGTLRHQPKLLSNDSVANDAFEQAFSPAGKSQPGATLEDARASLAEWLSEKGVPKGAIVIDNGSGLSRTSRVTARAMTQVLAAGWLSPRMTEYVASLPVSGVDGTMKKRVEAMGRTHLKTGYLQDVRSIGGYVYAKNGRRYAVYASVHGDHNMAGGIKFLDKVVEWTYLQR